MRMHEGQVDVAPSALAAALAQQFPAWAGRPLVPLPSAGTMVVPYRLGDDLVVRLPLRPEPHRDARLRLRAEGERGAALASRLPIEVSRLVAVGEPFEGHTGVWSIWTWVEGISLDRAERVDAPALARDLAATLTSFHAEPTGGADWSRNGRGTRPLADTAWVRESLEHSGHLLDVAAASRVWQRALAAPPYRGAPVVIHGDPVPGNLVLREGVLAGLIDIAPRAVGDPASDLAPAWTVFDEPARSVFREAMGLDEAAWERGRGWAFEMAIGGWHSYERSNPIFARQAARTLQRLLATA